MFIYQYNQQCPQTPACWRWAPPWLGCCCPCSRGSWLVEKPPWCGPVQRNNVFLLVSHILKDHFEPGKILQLDTNISLSFDVMISIARRFLVWTLTGVFVEFATTFGCSGFDCFTHINLCFRLTGDSKLVLDVYKTKQCINVWLNVLQLRSHWMVKKKCLWMRVHDVTHASLIRDRFLLKVGLGPA